MGRQVMTLIATELEQVGVTGSGHWVVFAIHPGIADLRQERPDHPLAVVNMPPEESEWVSMTAVREIGDLMLQPFFRRSCWDGFGDEKALR